MTPEEAVEAHNKYSDELQEVTAQRDELRAEVERLRGICDHQRYTLYFLEGTEDGEELHACDARYEEVETLKKENERLRRMEQVVLEWWSADLSLPRVRHALRERMAACVEEAKRTP